MLAEIPRNLVAKAYAAECLRQLQRAVEQTCFGCVHDNPSQRDHDLCLTATDVEKIEACSETLARLVAEERVGVDFARYCDILLIDTDECQHLFDAAARRQLLQDSSFWDLVLAYAVPL